MTLNSAFVLLCACFSSFEVDSLRLHTPDSLVDPKNIILFSTWQTPDDVEADEHRLRKDDAIRGSIQASTSCYARANGYTNFVDKVILPAEAPYSHYIKLAGYRQIMYRQNASGYQVPEDEWVMWMDADVRITNFDFKIEDLISRADPDTHVIVTPETNNCNLINDVFLVRNSKWGRRFMHVWDTFLQKGNCDHHDQCPMKMALIQIKRDMEDQSKLTVSDLDWPDHKAMARVDPDLLAAKPFQKGRTADGKITDVYTNLLMENGMQCGRELRDPTGEPFQFGPTFMSPSWLGTDVSSQFKTQLSSGGKNFDKVIGGHEDATAVGAAGSGGPIPFTVHAKYSATWCKGLPKTARNIYKPSEEAQMSFQEHYKAKISKICKAEEIEQMMVKGERFKQLPCWASWRLDAWHFANVRGLKEELPMDA